MNRVEYEIYTKDNNNLQGGNIENESSFFIFVVFFFNLFR